MKSTIFSVLLLVSMSFHGAAVATADGPDYFEIHNSPSGAQFINIYKEPSLQSQVIGKIPVHAKGIENLAECRGGFQSADEFMSASEKERKEKEKTRICLIKYKEIKGWVLGKFLTESSQH